LCPTFWGHYSVLCLEEPENGVTPERLSAVAELLQTIPTDFDDETNASEPLRQILINTHSTNLLKHIDLEDILFVFMVERQPRLTRIGHVTDKMFDYEEKSLKYYTLSSVRHYLEEGKRPSALEQQVNDAIEASR
jgi:predicted ATPase